MKKKPFVGDAGTDIVLDVGESIKDAAVRIKVMRPDGNETSWAATVTAGKVLIDSAVWHKTEESDLDVPGIYTVQAVIALADGSWAGRGDYFSFEVFA